MTRAIELPAGLAFLLIILGFVCAYAAFFWESAKKVLSDDAQIALGRFTQSRITWFGMFFLVLQTVIFTPFIEGHRWPFSYPADPAVLVENSRLTQMAQDSQTDAAKWRFALSLRYGPRGANNAPLACKFSFVLSNGPNAINIWRILQPMMELAHWEIVTGQNANPEVPFVGNTILTGDNKDAVACGTALAKAMGTGLPQLKTVFRTEQTSPLLTACKNECVELDIGD